MRDRCSGGHAPLNINLSAKLGKIHPALLGRIPPALTALSRAWRQTHRCAGAAFHLSGGDQGGGIDQKGQRPHLAA
jgi:folate-dependent phosphoribosylglycinamide formyltransferase PurN